MSDTTRNRDESILSASDYADAPNAISVPGFTLLEEIGRGGMGIVWRASDLDLGREVAVKILQDRFSVDSPICERFIEEAQITSQLQHPGIPAIYQVGRREDRRPFLAMKLIKGRTLDELIRLKLPLNYAAVFEAIAQAVGYAHAHGVIHRDLKPSNVMVGAFGEVQVMDWGLAKVLGSHAPELSATEETQAPTLIRTGRDSSTDPTQAGSIIGTPAYMAPEQAIGLVHQTDAQTDVFGLGGILCCLLSGKPPYVGNDNEMTRELAAHARLDDAFDRLSKCGASPALVELCQQCLSKEKADRPMNGEAVAAAVAKLREDAEERARQAELAKARADATRRTRRIAAGAIAAVLVLGIVGTTIGMFDARTARDAERDAKLQEKDRRAEAEVNLKVAHALSTNLIEASEKILPAVPEADKIRRGIIEASVAAFDQFTRQSPESGDWKKFTGLFLRYQGNIRRLTGDSDGALASYQRASDHYTRHGGSNFERTAALLDEAAIHSSLAHFEKSEDCLTRAANLLAAEPVNPRSQRLRIHLAFAIALERASINFNRLDCGKSWTELAAARSLTAPDSSKSDGYQTLAHLDLIRFEIATLRELDRAAEAQAAIEQADRSVAAMKANRSPRILADDFNFCQVTLQQDIVRTWMRERNSSRNAESRRRLNEMIRVLNNLIERHPDVLIYQITLATTRMLFAEFEESRNEVASALENSKKAIDLLQGLMKNFPRQPYLKHELSKALRQNAAMLGTSDTAKAVELLAASRMLAREAAQLAPEDLRIRALAESFAGEQND